MKSSFKKAPGSKIEIEVALDQKEFQNYWQSVYEQALANVQLKGFRPGTVPKELAEQAIDKNKIFEEAARKAVRSSLDELSQENRWTLVDSPQIEIVNDENGLRYKGILTVFPEVKLGNYQKIARKVLSEKRDVKVEPAEIEKSLEWLRDSRAKNIRANQPARAGNLVDASIESRVSGKPVENAQLNHDRFVLGKSRFMPGFDQNLENHKEREEVNFTIHAPGDYWQENLRDKDVDFKVKINAVFDREVPELNNDFAKGLGNFSGVEELKKSIEDGLLAEKRQKETDRLRLRTLDEIIKASQIDLPEIMVEKTLDNMVKELKPLMKTNTKTEAELRGQLRERAKNNVASNLVIYKIAELEKLEPAESEVEEIAGGNVDDSKKYQYNYGVILNKKVFNFLESFK